MQAEPERLPIAARARRSCALGRAAMGERQQHQFQRAAAFVAVRPLRRRDHAGRLVGDDGRGVSRKLAAAVARPTGRGTLVLELASEQRADARSGETERMADAAVELQNENVAERARGSRSVRSRRARARAACRAARSSSRTVRGLTLVSLRPHLPVTQRGFGRVPVSGQRRRVQRRCGASGAGRVPCEGYRGALCRGTRVNVMVIKACVGGRRSLMRSQRSMPTLPASGVGRPHGFREACGRDG